MRNGGDVNYGLAKLAFVLGALTAAVSTGEATLPLQHLSSTAVPTTDPSELSILSYNVEGLPWPIASGRDAAAGAIADRLADMRAAGTQPHIVAIQEAFGQAGKLIGRQAGYRYVAYGPSDGEAGAEPVAPQDRSFAAAASPFIGETLGKYADSGLAIFSDYPIRWTRRMAFPAYACAGLDCLANKGVLVVALDVPGAARPVIVVDTHLNSRSASFASNARSLYAYRRQVDALGEFVGKLPERGDMLLAGDFNVGNAPKRSAMLDQGVLVQAGLSLSVVEHDCGHDCRHIDEGGAAAETSLLRGKSLLAFSANGSLAPLGTPIGFGRLPDGKMLSDHIGIERRFHIGA